jgi:hypothetical protein
MYTLFLTLLFSCHDRQRVKRRKHLLKTITNDLDIAPSKFKNIINTNAVFSWPRFCLTIGITSDTVLGRGFA